MTIHPEVIAIEQNWAHPFLTCFSLREPVSASAETLKYAGRDIEQRSVAMQVRQYIRPDIAVSAIAHLSVLALVVLFAEVHPFKTVTETIAVDLVTPEQLEQKPDPAPTPQLPSSDLPSLTPTPPAAASPPQATTSPQRLAARPDRKEDAVQPPPQPQPAQPAQPQPQSPSASPGYAPPEPDVTVKYHVMLGLPEDLPPLPAMPGEKSGEKFGEKSGDKPGDFDATASTPANISSGPILEFRRHLKTCSKLPPSIAPSDNLTVKLRLLLTVDGRLAADPMVGGGSPNPKALDLLQSAIQALKACQPYTMLPADRYGEWKVLDLDLTPQDFSS
jgi:hypothetical protein